MRNDDCIDPPNSFTVPGSRRVLYRADGTPLMRPIGFAMSQTSGTFPQLKDNTIRRPPKKGKR